MKVCSGVTVLAAAGLLAAIAAAAGTDGSDAQSNRGATLFENRCARCHGIGGDGGDGLAPPLNGVVGKPVAGRADYIYSDAMKAKQGVWSAALLDQYIADPQAFAPGADMDVRSPDPAEREAIISYLKTL